MRPKAPETRKGHANRPKKEPVAEIIAAEDRVPGLVESLPPPPAHLGEVGVSVWYSVWALGGDSYHRFADAFIIERYASLQERRQELLHRMKVEGWVGVGASGQDVLNPLSRVLLDVESKLAGLEDRLGLSPESRARLQLGVAKAKSALDQFLDE